MNRLAIMALLTGWLLLAATPNVDAARGSNKARGPTGTFHGAITRVAGNTVQVNVGKETEKNVIFWTDKETSITGGGKRGTIADLEPGLVVTVKARNGRAQSIEVQVKKDDAEGGDKKKQKEKPPR